MGIEHALLPEKGLIAPGELIIGADSHTCTYGALGAFSTGVGSTDLAAGMATGEGMVQGAERHQVRAHRQAEPVGIAARTLSCTSSARSAWTALCTSRWNLSATASHALSMDDRFTICNMAIEAGAKNGIFPVDDKTMDYIKGRVNREVTSISRPTPTPSTTQTIEIDLSALRSDRRVPAPAGEHQDHRRARA